MPRTKIVPYQDSRGVVPVLDWLERLASSDVGAYRRCTRQIGRLAAERHQLRRPNCDYLRNSIFELRCSFRRRQFRILYFFHGHHAVVLSHALVKKRMVPQLDIEQALIRMVAFEENPSLHSYTEFQP